MLLEYGSEMFFVGIGIRIFQKGMDAQHEEPQDGCAKENETKHYGSRPVMVFGSALSRSLVMPKFYPATSQPAKSTPTWGFPSHIGRMREAMWGFPFRK